jgi:hypothetical protein
MWIQSVFNAISIIDSTHPGLVEKVSNFSHEDEWSNDQWGEYNQVAGAIVEPFSFPDCDSEDEEFYYERTERDGYGIVKGNLGNLPNSDSWKKMCDLIEKIGY